MKQCERCGAPHHHYITRSDLDGNYFLFVNKEGEYQGLDGYIHRLSEIPEEYATKLTWVVICQHTRNGVTQWLCQRCKLLATQSERTASARETRLQNKRQQKASEGQLSLFEEQGE